MVRRMLVLAGIVVMLCMGLQAAHADTTPSNPVITSQRTDTYTVYSFNPYSILESAIGNGTTIQTSQKTVDGKVQKSTQTTHQKTESYWLGGSVKIWHVSGDYTTTNDAGIKIASGTFTTQYTYDKDGQATGKGAYGSSTSKTYNAETGDLESSSTGKDYYKLIDGQVLKDYTMTNTTTYNKDGSVKGYAADNWSKTTYTYGQFKGEYLVTKTITESHTKDSTGSTAGSWSSGTETTTYKRDANGQTTGMGYTNTGTGVSYSDNKAVANIGWSVSGVSVKYNTVQGWYIASYTRHDWSEPIKSGSSSTCSEDCCQ